MNNINRLLLFFALLAAISITGNAIGVTITFNDELPNSYMLIRDEFLISEGMTFVGNPASLGRAQFEITGGVLSSFPVRFAYNGTNYLRTASAIFLSDRLFSLTSVDAAPAGWDWDNVTHTWVRYGGFSYNSVEFTGYRSDGTILQTSFGVDWINIGYQPFQTLVFGAEWSDLVRVEMSTAGSRAWANYDNFNVTYSGDNDSYETLMSEILPPYPPPSSVPDSGMTFAMLGSAVVGLALLGRRFLK